MANRFLNAPVGEGGGLSISQLNTWFAGKDTDDLAQGVLNLYITPAEKAIITSLSTATTAPTPNTIAKRDSSGSSSFYNISAVGMYLRFDNTTEPSITMLDTQGADYALLTDRNNNIPNLYLRNENQSGHLHIQGRQQIIFNTNNGANLQTASFNSSGLFIAPFITASGIITCNRSIINFSGNSVSANQSLADFNLINTNPNGNTKSAGIKFWMTDNIGQQKNIGHIFVRSDNANVVEGDLVLANSVVDYEANPTLTCKSDGRVYVRGLTSSGTLVSSSGLITTNISCGRINSLSGILAIDISASNSINSYNIRGTEAYLNRIEYPNLLGGNWVINNGTQNNTIFYNSSGYSWSFRSNTEIDLSGSVIINNLGLTALTLYTGLMTSHIGPLTLQAISGYNLTLQTPSGYAVRFTDLEGGGGHLQISNTGLRTTGTISGNLFNASTGLIATTISATTITMNNGDLTGFTDLIGSFIECAELKVNSTLSGSLINTSGLIVGSNGIRTTATISGGVVNASGLLAKNLSIRGISGIVNTSIGTDTDNINFNSFTNDTFYMTTNLTTASGLSFGTANQHRLSFLTNNTERVRITGNSGFVGINQTAPSQSLDVNGTIIAGQLNISGSGNSWRYEVLGNKTNGSTYTLPSGRWCGELHLQYGNDSGEVGLKKYAFYKAPGATGNGISGQQFYFYRSTTSAESGVGFDTNTGVFTFNLSGTNPSTSASIWYRSGT